MTSETEDAVEQQHDDTERGMTRRRALAHAAVGLATIGLSGAGGAGAARATRPRGATAAGRAWPALPGALAKELRALSRRADAVGCAVAATSAERLLFADGWGWAVLRRRPMTAASTVCAGSVSKTFTATAVLQQVAAGRIALDRDVNDYLRRSKVYGPRSVRSPHHPRVPITVRQLLTHLTPLTGGPEHGPYTFAYRPEAVPARALGEWLHDVLSPGGRGWLHGPEWFLPFAPGAKLSYSDTAYNLAGHLVEAVTGVGFAAYCRERILRPLGMTSSDHVVARTPAATRADPHMYVRNGVKRGVFEDARHLLRAPIPDGYTGHVPYTQYSTPFGPDGGLQTSAVELARWGRAWLGLGAIGTARVLPEQLARQALTNQVPAAILANATVQAARLERFGAMGLAWHRFVRHPPNTWHHAGASYGSITHTALDPGRGVAVSIVLNAEPHDYDPRDDMLGPLLDAAAAAA